MSLISVHADDFEVTVQNTVKTETESGSGIKSALQFVNRPVKACAMIFVGLDCVYAAGNRN